MMRASAQGHLEVVEYLLSQDANANLTNGRCAGHIAFPDLEVKLRDCAKQTTVMWAAHAGYFEVVRTLTEQGRAHLINYGAWIVAHEGPDTPLMLAAAAGPPAYRRVPGAARVDAHQRPEQLRHHRGRRLPRSDVGVLRRLPSGGRLPADARVGLGQDRDQPAQDAVGGPRRGLRAPPLRGYRGSDRDGAVPA